MTASKYFDVRDLDRSLWSSCVPCRSFWTPADISHADGQLSGEAVVPLIGRFFLDCWNSDRKLKIVFLSSAGLKDWRKEIDRGIQLTCTSEPFIDFVAVKGDWPKDQRCPDLPDARCFSLSSSETYVLLGATRDKRRKTLKREMTYLAGHNNQPGRKFWCEVRNL